MSYTSKSKMGKKWLFWEALISSILLTCLFHGSYPILNYMDKGFAFKRNKLH